MNGRLANACELLLRAAIDATRPGGVTYTYFGRQGRKEAAMRQLFAEHEVAENPHGTTVSVHSDEILRHLNSFYATRLDLRHLGEAYRILMESVVVFRRDHRTTITLLGSSDSERDEIQRVLVSAIARITEAGSNRPYSLSSKFLHFLLPETFAIFDDQAATSIAMWRYFAFECEAESGAGNRIASVGASIARDKSGSGYRGVLDFYRVVWSRSSNQLREDACKAASEFQTYIQERYDTKQARFTVLDLIDKLLWRGDGNPVVLGLSAPQEWGRGVPDGTT